ncbi:putative cysteine proteinase inhibitor 7 [Brachypodium distachyon]|nr:putative cysteine proteinase inhibitor 7 [Brachypodium distachyon]|eukprot:XP_003581024.1 putative cysteine proteinase inhibitor 7 [Brachypodium distachyon]
MRISTSFLLVAAAGIIYAIAAVPAATGCDVPFEDQSRTAGLVGAWVPIGNVNDPHIQMLGGWAVSEYGNRANCRLKFHRVVSGRRQVVSGTNYELIIDASPELGGGKDGRYKAVVYEQGWSNVRNLVSFSRA